MFRQEPWFCTYPTGCPLTSSKRQTWPAFFLWPFGDQEMLFTISSDNTEDKLKARGRHAMLMSPDKGETAVHGTLVPSVFVPLDQRSGGTRLLSMAATAWVIWLCACVRYWPGRGLVYVCHLL